MALPNCIIGGTSRAGSTSLFRYLTAHPQVCGSSIKETNFFILHLNSLEEDLDVYESYFSHCSSRATIRLEATPHYLQWGEKIAHPMSRILPNVKLIFILREPIERFVSIYRVMKHSDYKKFGRMSFSELMEFFLEEYHRAETSGELTPKDWVRSGYYATFLSEYFKYFPKKKICVLFFDHLKKDPYAFVCKATDFLGIDTQFYDAYRFTLENRSRIPRVVALRYIAAKVNQRLEKFFNFHPNVKKCLRYVYCSLNEDKNAEILIQDETKQTLAEFYAPYNKELFHLLQRYGRCDSIPDWILSAGSTVGAP